MIVATPNRYIPEEGKGVCRKKPTFILGTTAFNRLGSSIKW
jgi:hypothetical protein